MIRKFYALLAVAFLITCLDVSAQTVKNPKLAQKDLETAQSQSRDAGGSDAELVYAARLDAIQKGSFDSLVVIYAKPSKKGKDFYAMVIRDDKKYTVAFDKQGRVIRSGDQFMRIGLKYEEGKSPLLRIIASTIDTDKGEMQRNLDFRFSGSEFVMEAQSLTMVAR